MVFLQSEDICSHIYLCIYVYFNKKIKYYNNNYYYYLIIIIIIIINNVFVITCNVVLS